MDRMHNKLLRYQAFFIIDAIDENNTHSYSSNVPAANYFQHQNVANTGYTRKLSFNISTS
jgi:hypothetical protein